MPLGTVILSARGNSRPTDGAATGPHHGTVPHLEGPARKTPTMARERGTMALLAALFWRIRAFMGRCTGGLFHLR
ncbi:hypothetical protein [Deinococcus geothermalis]|uniref:hypothetical protein n=1 Tax=Deinococcus geothermalis TaxID=68909 RepID=UPI00235731D1|nr:hypothetical protein [Deinococcus geothermalis]